LCWRNGKKLKKGKGGCYIRKLGWGEYVAERDRMLDEKAGTLGQHRVIISLQGEQERNET